MDFRNYQKLDVGFEEDFNIIYGNNAQGKTNIIEAIFLCASGRSHRTSKDSELLKYGMKSFKVNIVVEREDDTEEIEIYYSVEERKKIKINGLPVKKIGELMGHFNAIMFSPEDLLLIKQGPSERRRFIDITLSQLKPAYFYDLQQYSKILYQRNTLLKNIIKKRDLLDTLDVWDRHIVKSGMRIMKARSRFVKRLDDLAKTRHFKLTKKEEMLSIKYCPSFQFEETLNESEIEDVFVKLIKKNRDKDILRGITCVGPHRDDLDIFHNGEITKIYGSQGQQRTAVLSMKLAEIDLMKEESGDYPVLLLDDVLSELDDSRKEYLLESLSGIQTFITSTDKRFFQRSDASAAFFCIENGNIKSI